MTTYNLMQTLFGEEEVEVFPCISCKEMKPIYEFRTERYGVNNKFLRRRKDCLVCEKKEAVSRRERNKDIFISENHQCLICGKTEFEIQEEFAKHHNGKKYKSRIWTIDHNHETGETRGVICYICNSYIALFDRDLVLADKIREYVTKNGKI